MISSKTEAELDLKKKLRVAGINKTPKEFRAQVSKSSLIIGIMIGILSYFPIVKMGMPIILTVVVGLIFMSLVKGVLTKTLDAKINRQAKEIDKDVLFAGRFLLIKLNSGKPLINSLIDASRSYGVSSQYFKGLVRQIELGTTLEKALERARDECPSNKMKKILFQIHNALKIGIDVSENLEAVIEDIANDQLVEIQRYGKKLSSLTMFYMLIAVVLPSLGMTMLVVVAGLVSLNLSPSTFFVLGFFLLLIELVFITLFKSIRPNINI